MSRATRAQAASESLQHPPIPRRRMVPNSSSSQLAVDGPISTPGQPHIYLFAWIANSQVAQTVSHSSDCSLSLCPYAVFTCRFPRCLLLRCRYRQRGSASSMPHSPQSGGALRGASGSVTAASRIAAAAAVASCGSTASTVPARLLLTRE